MQSPSSAAMPSGKLMDAINTNFSSFASFKNEFNEAAKTRFGSGWAWLVFTNDKKLVIGSTPNQDNPLMDVSALKGMPVLVWMCGNMLIICTIKTGVPITLASGGK